MTIANKLAGAMTLLAALIPVPTLAADCAIALPPGFNGAAPAGAGAAPQVVVQGHTRAGTESVLAELDSEHCAERSQATGAHP